MTKNITLAVDEDVLQRVREIAVQEKTTVNGLVRAFLEEKAEQKDDQERRRLNALKNLRELSKESNVKLGGDWQFDRESLYER